MAFKKLSSFCFKNQPAVILCLFGFFFYFSITVYRYVHFSYQDWDQALISQSLWNLWHGKLYSSLYGFNTFGDHSTFINLLVLPLFAIFPHPLTISFLEIFLFSASALFLYFMILQDLDKNPAFLMTFVYLFFLPNFLSICHDFNTETMTPFFILLVIYFYRKNEVRNFYFSFLFLFLFKENMPLIVAMIGIWGIFSKDRNRMLWGVLPIVLSLVYFFIMVKWVIPHFRGMKQYSLLVRYSYLGSDPLGVFFHLMRFKTLKYLFLNPVNINYLRALFGVFLVPALLSPSVLLLAAPIILYHLLSLHMPEKTIYYYYAAAITPIIFLASVQTLKKFKALFFYRRTICWFFILISFFQLLTYRPQIVQKIGLYSDGNVSQEWKLVKMIPPAAGVVATFKFLPALSLRENLFSLHKVYSEEYQNPVLYKKSDFYTGKVFNLPGDVTFALIDFNDPWLQRSLRDPSVKHRIDGFLKGWVLINSSGLVNLYGKIK